MKYNIISSGSKGNSIIIENFFMLDCGLSYTKIKPYLKDLKLIFVSHAHSDHINKITIKRLAYEKPNLKYIVGSKDLISILSGLGIKSSNIYALNNSKWYDLGIIKIRLEPLTHDVANSLCKFEIKDKKGIYIVDTSNVDNVSAKNYDLYLIESNYKQEILDKHTIEKELNNEYDYLKRVENAHLSYEQANDFLIENMGNNSIYEYIHKSDYNFEE